MSATLVEYDASYLEPLVRLWREAFEFGVGVTDPHPLSEQREYFLSQVLPANQVTLALLDSRLVGFMAASRESVCQLHVQVGFHRQGIGSALLGLAKERSSGSLWLYTFTRNVRACAFYEKHGFVVVERGFEPNWKLDDVKYSWSAQTRGGI
ncbi:MAG: N-acetyltransferase [Betaproteobacteria bacterium]|nr:MAG: N-acetyltransferase [Betaproteobacteria bacterium]